MEASVEHSSLEISLKRVDRIYRPGEKVQGVVIVSATRGGWQHKGIVMRVVGAAKLQQSQKGGGLFESVTSGNATVKVREMVRIQKEIAAAGRVGEGVSEIPFEFELRPQSKDSPLAESYHGVYVNVQYAITVECKRSMMKAPLEREMEFVVEVPTGSPPASDPKAFSITPESLENVRATSLSSIPRFKISGKLHRQSCPMNLPFTGELVVEESEAAVKSVELLLVRSETVKQDTGAVIKEATEIQNLQIADGDVCRNLVVPIYMIFPRLFTCPSLAADEFKVDFEVNLIVVFADGYCVTENFPIKLHRFR
mmetsp:Transcript_11909/g.35768  ORF Transcript_11909/g.35768 Transcript_11909/m.35768 type:complete len:311 (-) Transcript_11909:108-1040(-)